MMKNQLLFVLLVLCCVSPIVAATALKAVSAEDDDNDDNNGNDKDVKKAFQTGTQFGIQTQKEAAANASAAAAAAAQQAQQQQQQNKTKPDKNNQICDPKVNVKAIGNVVNGTEYVANLDGLAPQTKIAEETGTIVFHFDFNVKKQQQQGGGSGEVVTKVKPTTSNQCIGKDTVLQGDVQGNPFEVAILKKTNQVSVTIP